MIRNRESLPVKRTLSTQINVTILASSILTLVAFIIVFSLHFARRFEQDLQNSARYLGAYYSQRFSAVLAPVENLPESMVAVFDAGILTKPHEIEAAMRKLMEEEVSEAYGTAMAFEPTTITTIIPGKRYYCPYFHRRESQIVFDQLGNFTYNYFKWDWYTLPKKLGRSLWSEPYFDKGGGNVLMITYSVPFFRDGRFVGVATADLSLNDLQREIGAVRVAKTGYAFLVSRSGMYVSFPNKSNILKAKLSDTDMSIWQAFNSKTSGLFSGKDPLSGKDAWIWHEAIHGGNFFLAVVYPVSEVLAPAFGMLVRVFLIGLCLIAIVAVIVHFMSGRITKSLTNLVNKIRQIGGGDLQTKIDISTENYELWQLTSAFNRMTRELGQHIESEKSLVREKERLSGEVKIAASIQRDILPSTFPAFPKRKEIDLFATNIPAREIGGDFYDYFFVDEDHLAFVIADVSGKGVPAAMFMAVCRTLIRAAAVGMASPSQCLTRVNRLLCAENTSNMFVTIFLGVMNIRSGEIRHCNGGHNPPFILRSSGEVVRLDGSDGVGGMALGVEENAVFGEQPLSLDVGDKIFLFTDGITEAMDPENQFYGDPRLYDALCRNVAEGPHTLIEQVIGDVNRFCRGYEQADDITVLCIARVNTRPSLLGPIAIEKDQGETKC